MSVENFLDTNTILYMFDRTDQAKRERAEQLVRDAIETGNGCISYQVVQEALNVASKKLGFSPDDSLALLRNVLVPLWTLHPSPGLYERGLALHGSYGFSFYDSMIVSAALESGCARLYSEDLQHGQRIQSLTIENPFA